MAGDVNSDGRITTADSLLALQMATGSIAPDPKSADVNHDGMVNSLDALRIRMMAQKAQVRVDAPEVVSGAFDVTIDIENVADMNGGQFDLSFDSSVVSVADVSAGDIAGTNVPISIWRPMDEDTIRVIFRLRGADGVSGSGYVAKIGFETTGSGTSILDIFDGKLSDTEANKIPAIWIDDEVAV